MPEIGQWMLSKAHPEWTGRDWIGLSQLNAYFMAGWVGMLITGLNMMPISQLDGGHTIYALFLDRAHLLARWFVIISILYILVHINDACDVDANVSLSHLDGNPSSAHCE